MACIEEERKKAFVVFASTYEAAKYLTIEQKGELFEMLGAYSLEGKEVHSNNPLIDVILKMSIPNMDAAERRHQAAIEKGKKGKDGGGGVGRPRKGETKEEYQDRVSEWRVSRDSENPQKPLNKDKETNTDKETDKNKDKNIERDRDTDVDKDRDIEIKKDTKRNTNVEVIPNSSSINSVCISNLQNPVLEYTKEGVEPNQEKARYQVSISNSKYQEEPRQGEKQGSKESDFLRSITLDDDFDDTPSVPPSAQYQNYAESIQDIIRYDAEPDYEGMTDAEMMDAVKEAIDDALECLIRRAVFLRTDI